MRQLYIDFDGVILDTMTKTYKNAKEAKLDYEVISYLKKNTLVKINLITGRYNQIRVQFSNIGYPLKGDKKYGNNNKVDIRLFSYMLEFIHPVTKERMSFKLLPKWEELDYETIIHRL